MTSSRHHYLPVFYLKGFTGSDGKFFVFNKAVNTIDNRARSPKSIFFEKDRNSIATGDESNDFLEQIYSKLDSDLAPAFKRFQQKKDKEISARDIVEARFFANLLYWRLPSNDSVVIPFLNGLTREQRKFMLKDREGNEAPDEVFRTLLKDEDFMKAYKLTVPLVNVETLSSDDAKDFKFYFSATDSLHVVGDSPLICKDSILPRLSQSEFILPITKSVLLLHKKGPQKASHPPELRVKIDLLVFMQSQKYVCSINSGYLNMIAKLASVYTEERIANLKAEIFEAV